MRRPTFPQIVLPILGVALVALALGFEPFRVVGLALGLLVLMFWCIWALPAWLVAQDMAFDKLPPDQRASALNGSRSAVVQGVVGLLALGAVAVAWQQLRTEQERSRIERQQLSEQLALTRQAQATERFTRAINQIGSDKTEAQVAGIYGLEQIAKESDDTRLLVFQILSSYVRQHASRNLRAASPERSRENRVGNDVEGIRVAMTALAQGTVRPPPSKFVGGGTPPLDLRNIDLHGIEFHNALEWTDLTGVILRGSDLSGVSFAESRMSGADLQGAVYHGGNLEGTDLTGANLAGISLQNVKIERTSLGGANLTGAQLQGRSFEVSGVEGANFSRANLEGADFARCILRGTNFSGANLKGANFEGADLQDAQFTSARADATTRWPTGFDWRGAGVKSQ
jgi:uncharacterized protein YjbI with pentapeptide repeats